MNNSPQRTRALAAGLACTLLFGCAGSNSADVLFGGLAGAPDAVPPVDPPNSNDGLYTGTADVRVNGDLGCRSPLSISNFRVEGETVRFGGFRGPIAPDGTVRLPYGGAWLQGRFEGPTFTGTIDTNAAYAIPIENCIYSVSVRRVGG